MSGVDVRLILVRQSKAKSRTMSDIKIMYMIDGLAFFSIYNNIKRLKPQGGNPRALTVF